MNWQVRIEARLGQLRLAVDVSGGAGPIVVIGGNGAGKTSLLRLIAGAHRPSSGRISVGARTLFDAERGVDLPPEHRRVAYVPQGYGLFPHLSALDNAAFGRSPGGATDRATRRREALELLEQLDCAHLAKRMPSGLSGGERQRVALARALFVDPDLLLLDEPLSALDASARRSVRRFLAEHLMRRGRPSIVVTHDVRDVLAFDAPVWVLEAGRVLQRGSAAELQAAPASAFVAEFFDAALALPSRLRSA